MSGSSNGKSSTKLLVCKSLQGYLKSLPKDILSKLYKYPATCLAVYRELPEMSQYYVKIILFICKPISQSIFAAFIEGSNGARENVESALLHKRAMETLLDLHIMVESHCERGNLQYQLNQTFQENFKIATLGGGTPWTMSTHSDDGDPHHKDSDFLDKYANERWENILQFLVNPTTNTGSGVVISRDAVRTLAHAGLIENKNQGENMQITSGGFQFLLMDQASQVWYFILKYLETVPERGIQLDECLTFLFKLSFSTLGKNYSMDGLSAEMLSVLQHLREFGLVYLKKRSLGLFYPTRLALNITEGKNKSNLQKKEGNLVIETNYRVYAYTDNELQISLLSIFTDLECRFTNLVVANITRTSVRKALIKGIGAEQIISYLLQHCHPEMYKQNPILPRTVADQIKLWELERERLEYTDGVLYKDFMSVHDYSLLSNFAESNGLLVYSDEKSRTMIVTKKGHPQIKNFWKEAQNK